MSRKFVWLASVLILILGMWVFSGCGKEAETSESQNQATAPVQFGKGHPSPDFNLKRLEGGELQLSSLQGKAVIVDFWDTWCPPCRKAMPHLQELSVQYADDLVVVGVAMGREGEAKVRQFTQDRGLTFEMVMFNKDPQLIKDFGGISSIPTTILIDPEGIVREVWVGGFGKETYEAALKTVLGT